MTEWSAEGRNEVVRGPEEQEQLRLHHPEEQGQTQVMLHLKTSHLEPVWGQARDDVARDKRAVAVPSMLWCLRFATEV